MEEPKKEYLSCRSTRGRFFSSKPEAGVAHAKRCCRVAYRDSGDLVPRFFSGVGNHGRLSPHNDGATLYSEIRNPENIAVTHCAPRLQKGGGWREGRYF